MGGVDCSECRLSPALCSIQGAAVVTGSSSQGPDWGYFPAGFFPASFPSLCHGVCCVCLPLQVPFRTAGTLRTGRAAGARRAPPRRRRCPRAGRCRRPGPCRHSSPAPSKPLCPPTSAPAWAPTCPTPAPALPKVIAAARPASLPARAALSALPLALSSRQG